MQIFLGQFKSILIWILIAAGIISGVLGEMVDGPGYLDEQKIDMTDKRVEPLQAQGKTVVFVLVDGKLKGAIALADIIRPEAKQAIDALKALNIRCIMLTGDNKATGLGMVLCLQAKSPGHI